MSKFRNRYLLFSLGVIAGVVALVVAVSHSDETSGDRQLFRSAFPLDALRSVDPADAKVSTEILIRRIVEKQGFDYTTAIPKDHAEFLSGLARNQYDFFLIFSSEYLKNRESYPMKPRVVGVRDGDSPMERLVLLTAANAKIEDLRGGKLLIQSGSGDLSTIWLEEELAARGVSNPSEFFGEIKDTRSVGESVLPVFFGKADACIVADEALGTMVELNPQIEVRLTRQMVSDPLLSSLMCVRADYREKTPGIIEEVSTTLHDSPDGGQILTLMRIEKLVPFEEKFLEGTEKLLSRRIARLAAENSKKTETDSGSAIARKNADDE